MTTSVRDLARFAMLQFRDGPAGGAQILAGPTVREMQRVHWLEPDWQAGWGLGFRIVRQDGRTRVGHGGAVSGYRTQLWCLPADRVAVVVLSNADDGNPLAGVEKAIKWILPAIVQAATPEEPPRRPEPAWQRYVGRYRSPWADSQVLFLRDGLAIIDPSQPDPLPAASTLTPVAEHTFRVVTRDGFGSHGELVTFELDAQGAVVRMKLGENYSDPVLEW